jgi:Type II secretion system (T2SS), protein M subtype b
MRNFQTKKQLIIAGLAILLIADVALVYFNSILASPENDRKQTLTAESRQLALVKADVERASKIRETIPDILRKFDQFEATLLPASKGSSVISQELDDYARDTHLIVEDTQWHQKDLDARGLQELYLDASVSGDYNGIVNFLNRLQRSKNVYIVDSLSVDTAEAGHGPAGALRVSLHMRTYFRKA